MDFSFSKTVGINTDYKDRKATPNWESLLVAEVVFIEKSQGSTLYQLKDSSLLTHNYHTRFPKDAFMPIGEVAHIDKKKKLLLLTNKNTVAYTYLIIATCLKGVVSLNDEEFAAGLQALIDALRMKSKISTSLNEQNYLPSSSSKSSSVQALQEHSDSNDLRNIPKIVHPYISSIKLTTSGFNTTGKRVYEVHL